MSKEFDYPRGVRSSLNIKLAKTDRGQHVAAANKQFLEAMRPAIQNAIKHNKKRRYVTPAAMEDYLSDCDKRFRDLRKFIKKLPAHVKRELGKETVIELKKNLKALIKPDRTRHPKLPGSSNFFRSIFLAEMLREYRQAFGEYPDHTYSRRKSPEESKIRGFHGVAYVMCELAGFSPAGIENELAGVKKVKPLKPIEEVQAEIKARKEAKPTD